MASGPSSRMATRRAARPPSRRRTGTALPMAWLVIAACSCHARFRIVRRRSFAGSRRAAIGEVAPDIDEGPGELVARLLRKARERLLAGGVAERAHAREDRLRLCRQIELAGAPIEALAHQPGNVVQQKAEARIEVMPFHDRNIISKLVISKPW